MAFKAGKATKSHKAESCESQPNLRESEAGGSPVKAKFSHQKPIKSHLKAIHGVRQAGSNEGYFIRAKVWQFNM